VTLSVARVPSLIESATGGTGIVNDAIERKESRDGRREETSSEERS